MRCLTFLFILPAFLAVRSAHALETEVSTGIFYYPSDAEKLMRAQTENGEDGLTFTAPPPEREVAHDYAEEELHNGNVCLRQARTGLKAALRQWHVRELCTKVFKDAVAKTTVDAGQEKLHPDHVECHAEVEAREQAGRLSLELVLRADLVMRDRTPAKLRKAGLGGEQAHWELPSERVTLGSVEGGWKDALKAGACAADSGALDHFWDTLQQRAADARELVRCRDDQARELADVSRLQKQLKEYVPEDWVRERAGEGTDALFEPLASVDPAADLAACHEARETADDRLSALKKVAGQIADKYDIPALNTEHRGDRAPASDSDDDEE